MDDEITFPSAAEFEAGWQRQLQQERERAAQAKKPLPTDAAVELGLLEESKPALDDRLHCHACGQVFKYARVGMSKMQLSRHLKRRHPELVPGV